jgi:putative membrane protein insertion efficiency factor
MAMFLSALNNKLNNIASTVLLKMISAYQILLSPFVGQQCRFTPSCSVYAQNAIVQHGAARGSVLAFWRVCRCNPFCRGGHDPVPTQVSFPSTFISTHHDGSQT